MSLRIDVDAVTAVMVGGRWHEVTSLAIDSYEFLHWSGQEDKRNVEMHNILHGGGDSGVCAVGFTAQLHSRDGSQEPEFLSGPLTELQAVRHRRPDMPRTTRRRTSTGTAR